MKDEMAIWLHKCAEHVVNDFKENEGTNITTKDVFVVWSCKTLQNKKAMVSTAVSGNTSYYEFTYSGNRHETYVDKYKKDNHRVLAD